MVFCWSWQIQRNSGGTGAAGTAGKFYELLMYFVGLAGAYRGGVYERTGRLIDCQAGSAGVIGMLMRG